MKILKINIVGNRIDGHIMIDDRDIGTITAYCSDTTLNNSSIAIVVYDNKAYSENFEQVINDMNDFIGTYYRTLQKEFLDNIAYIDVGSSDQTLESVQVG